LDKRGTQGAPGHRPTFTGSGNTITKKAAASVFKGFWGQSQNHAPIPNNHLLPR
jgi:hypothetical protein